MSVIDTLVTDRVPADVTRWSNLRGKGWAGMTSTEKTEWLAGLKGAYNAVDLNRVESAVAYLRDRFNALPAELAGYLSALGVAPDDIFGVPYGYPIDLTTKTDWAVGDTPSPDALARYISNIAALRAVLTLPDGTPEPPESMDGLTVTGANNIELVLQAVDAATLALEALIKGYADHAAEAFIYAGEAYSGEF